TTDCRGSPYDSALVGMTAAESATAFWLINPNPKLHPHVRKCSNHCQAHAWSNGINRECNGAYCARSIPMVDLCPTKPLRPAYGRNSHVVRNSGCAAALFCNSHL